MNYREMLIEFRKNKKFNLLTLMVADEVDSAVQHGEKDFENICKLVERAYLKSDYLSINNIAVAIDNFLNDENYTIEELQEMNIWDLLEKINVEY